MNSRLSELKVVLIDGQRRAGQGSYQRRAPAAAAVPYLLKARREIRHYLKDRQEDAEAWRLLAQAEECLLNYAAALDSLRKAISLSDSRDRKDLKRLAGLEERSTEWAELGLTPLQLEALGAHLHAGLAEAGCDHTLRLTNAWLASSKIAKFKMLTASLRNRGGYCDCEVLANVVGG